MSIFFKRVRTPNFEGMTSLVSSLTTFSWTGFIVSFSVGIGLGFEVLALTTFFEPLPHLEVPTITLGKRTPVLIEGLIRCRYATRTRSARSIL